MLTTTKYFGISELSEWPLKTTKRSFFICFVPYNYESKNSEGHENLWVNIYAETEKW